MKHAGWPGTVIAVALVALAAGATVADRRVSQGDRAKTPLEVPRLPFEKYTLPNGLEVILSQDSRLPLVAVDLWYHVGPANEAADRTGFAHLFEHMMFQGSKHVPPDTHFRFLEAAGASSINGTTDFDRTNYFETLPSNQLDLALWLESDRMGYLLDKIDVTELRNQQDVVRNERRQSYENTPYGLADEAVVQSLFPPGHPYYGNVIGSHQDIQAAKLDDVKQFFKQYYTPNNASLVIVGDFDREPAKALVAKYFGTLKRGAPVPPVTVQTPVITTERVKVLHDRVELPRVYLAWITPPFFKPGDADADVTATLLGGGKTSRLYKRLVYERQIAQDVSAQQYSLALGSIFQIQATARPGHSAAEIQTAVERELEQLRARPPAVEEVDRARNTIQTRIVEGLERLGGFGGVADRLNTYNHYLGTPDYLRQDIQRYDAVTPETVNQFVNDRLQPNARAVVQVVPGTPDLGSPPPTPPPVKAAAGEGSESVNADESWRNTPPAAGPARPLRLPVPESVQLPNGLTLMLDRREGLPVVAANLVVRTGSDANPAGQPGLAAFTAAMLDEGTADRSALQIADGLAQLGATLVTSSTMDATTVQARSLKKTFPQTLDLIADVALAPAFPADEIERERGSRLARIVEQRNDPRQLASATMAAALYGDRHPYGFTEIGTDGSVRGITRDDLHAFWQRSFVPGNAALVVAGDISMAELRPLAERAFGAWSGAAPPRTTIGAPATTPDRVIIVDKPGAPQTALRLAAIGAARSAPDVDAIEVMNMTLGGMFSSRINLNLREEHGYTYGASSQFTFRRSAGPFVAGGGIRTDATAPSVTEILKEIRRMIDTPMTADELQMAKDALARSVPANFETSGSAASSFSETYVYDLGLDYFSTYAARIEAVTAEAALQAARTHLRPDALVVIAVGDKATIEPALRALHLGPTEVWTAEAKPVGAR